MELSVEQKIKRFHSEEIKLILFICATDLSKYEREHLVLFTECIEGRIEDLFEPDYLRSDMQGHFKVDDNIILKFLNLKKEVRGLYASQWHKKMRERIYWGKINELSKEILQDLNIEYEEPNSYLENHLDIDWT